MLRQPLPKYTPSDRILFSSRASKKRKGKSTVCRTKIRLVKHRKYILKKKINWDLLNFSGTHSHIFYIENHLVSLIIMGSHSKVLQFPKNSIFENKLLIKHLKDLSLPTVAQISIFTKWLHNIGKPLFKQKKKKNRIITMSHSRPFRTVGTFLVFTHSDSIRTTNYSR